MGTKISNLPAATTVNAGDLVAIVQNGTTMAAEAADIANAVASAFDPAGAASSVQANLTNSQPVTFTNSTTRAAATPAFIGQIGSQQSDGSFWVGTATTIGAWAVIPYISTRLYNQPYGVPQLDANGTLTGPIIEKRDTAANLANVTLRAGEIAGASDSFMQIAMGDGTTSWDLLPKALTAYTSHSLYANTTVLSAGQLFFDPNVFIFVMGDGTTKITNQYGFLNADYPLAGQTLAYQYNNAFPRSGTVSPDLFLDGCYFGPGQVQTGNITVNNPTTTSPQMAITETQRIVMYSGTPSAASSGLTITWGTLYKFGTDSSGNNFQTKLNALLAAGGSVKYRIEFEFYSGNWQCVSLVVLG